MIEKVLYLDHSILTVDYKEGLFQPSSGGSLSYGIRRGDSVEMLKPKEKDTTVRFIDHVFIDVNATNNTKKKKDQTAFTLKVKFEVIYELPIDEKDSLTEEFFSDYDWFFRNNAYQIAHKISLSIIENTKFRGVIYQIPKHRIDENVTVTVDE